MNAQAYAAARHRAAVADISDWGKILYRGADRRKALHGLFSADLLRLEPGHGLLSCVLTPKGKLVADFALYDLGDEFLSLQLPQATERIAEALKKPLMLSETMIEDRSRAWAALLIVGPQTPKVLEQQLGVRPLGAYECGRADWQGQPLIVASYPRFALDGAIVITDHKERLETALDLETIDEETLETLRVEAGVPAVGVDTDDETLPLELPLEPAIDFEKGCYMGQETTARMKNFGHANRALVGLKLEKPAEPGAPVLFEDKQIGRLTSIVQSPAVKGFLGLATIRKEHRATGTRLEVEGAATAEIVALPLR